MGYGRGKSRKMLSALVSAGLGVLLLAFANPAGAAPAVDEYGANLPTAKGQKSQGSTPPQSRPELLSPAVSEELQASPKGKELEAVATADELGAPDVDPKLQAGFKVGGETTDEDSDEGLLSGLVGALGEPLILLLLAALMLSGIAAWQLRPRESGSS